MKPPRGREGVWGVTLTGRSMFLVLWCLVGSAVAAERPASRPVAGDMPTRLNALLARSGLGATGFAIWVGDAEQAGPAAYHVADDRPMVPASISKIPTALAVLKQFPPGHMFETRLMASAPVRDGHLTGPLYLKGGGDPEFVSEQMWALVKDFSRQGITAIDGGILVDQELFADDPADAPPDGRPDTPNAQEPELFRALGSASFNWNSVAAVVSPGGLGEPGRLWLDPPNGGVSLVNRTTTVAQAGANPPALTIENGPAGDVVTVTGEIQVGAGQIEFYRAVGESAHWAGAGLRQFLTDRGIAVNGPLGTGRAPAGARPLASVSSRPVQQLVQDMLKHSNNFMAEIFAKDLAVAAGQRPGRLSGGLQAIERVMAGYGVNPARLRLASASGLSRFNRFEARELGALLQAARQDFTVFPEFLSGLPIAGLDGTLKNRPGGKVVGWVRAKTGTLDGTVSLAGYAGARDGRTYAFVFIYNGQASPGAVRSLFDRMAAAVAG